MRRRRATHPSEDDGPTLGALTCDGRVDGALLESTPAPRHQLETPSSAGDALVPPSLVPTHRPRPRKQRSRRRRKRRRSRRLRRPPCAPASAFTRLRDGACALASPRRRSRVRDLDLRWSRRWRAAGIYARPTPAPHHELATPSSYVHFYCPRRPRRRARRRRRPYACGARITFRLRFDSHLHIAGEEARR